MRWIEAHAKPRMNYHRSMESLELPGDFHSLLTRYMKLAPFLVPKNSEVICTKTLSHPDLQLDKIFINPETKKITHIIDWQSTSVSEVYLQQGFPPINQHRHVLSHYERLIQIRNPQRWAVLKDRYISIPIYPISLVCGAWDRRDLFSFRHALITAVAHWKRISQESGACPIHFTAREIELHETEMDLLEGLEKIKHQLQEENIIPLGGMVLPEHYEQAKTASYHFKEFYISLGEDEQRKTLHSKIWPYQDT